MMQTFFSKTGNAKLRFKPAYNPYTEPSMEVFSYHEGLKKWIEVGNVSSFVGRGGSLQRILWSWRSSDFKIEGGSVMIE